MWGHRGESGLPFIALMREQERGKEGESGRKGRKEGKRGRMERKKEGWMDYLGK